MPSWHSITRTAVWDGFRSCLRSTAIQKLSPPRHQDTKTPRHQDAKTPRHQDTKTPRRRALGVLGVLVVNHATSGYSTFAFSPRIRLLLVSLMSLRSAISFTVAGNAQSQ